jgi:ATP-dependent DNA helicase RecG
MAEIIGVSRQSIAKHIAKLKEQGVIRRIGPDKGGHWEVSR